MTRFSRASACLLAVPILALGILVAASAPALAQTKPVDAAGPYVPEAALAYGARKAAAQEVSDAAHAGLPTRMQGLDSVSGLPCLVGDTATCVLPSSATLSAGSISVSTTAKSTAADPTEAEGSTNSQLSIDLSGYLRARGHFTLDAGANTIGVVNLGTLNGAATAANQTTANSSLGTIATNTSANATAANQAAVIGSKAAGAAAINSLLTGGVFNTALPTLTNTQQAALQLDATGRLITNPSGVTQPVSAASLPLPSGAATSANQATLLANIGTPGTSPCASAATACDVDARLAKIQQAAEDNTTASPVSAAAAAFADGAIATLGLKADAKSTATDTTSVTMMQVLKEISALEQAPASRAVTNAGTFAVQSTLQTQTDTVMVGAVNVKEVGGTATPTGVGNAAAGVQRVSPAFAGATQYTFSTTTAETIEVIPLSGSLTTYVLFDKVMVDGTVTFTWKTGTGTNCGTGTTTLEGPYNLTAADNWVEGNGSAPVLIVPAGKALCRTTSAGTVQTSGKLLAVQF